MDDDMEDEIIREIVHAHFHLVWKYVSITSTGLAELILPGPGESFKNKMFQPGPFMFLTLLIIISSIILQTKHNWLQKALLTCHRTISLNVVTDRGLKSFVTASIGSDNISQELNEGIVGVYALQGRRGTMEDRFNVLQEVDVGGSKKLSFYGVYDGHGGQFVAEYVKQNLFINTVQKIRQVRASNKDKNDNNRSKLIKRNSASNLNDRRRRSCTPATDNLVDKTVLKERRPSGAAAYDTNLNTIKDEDTNPKGMNDKEMEVKTNRVIEEEEEGERTGCKVEEVKKEKRYEAKVETKKEKEGVCESLKKEDPYSCINLRKRNSVASVQDLMPKQSDHKSDTSDNNSYVDVNSNVNYTKLLNDQIMDIDKKVVEFCKSRTDLSGTTAVIAVVDGELLIIGNVGDSRAVMGDLKGSTIPLSFDHKPNQLKERRRIKEAGGFITFTGVWRVAGILATSRALGDFPLKDPRKLITAEPDILTFSLKDHKAHFIILATDGLWDVLSNEEAVAFIRSHIHEKDYGARSLVLHAYDKGSHDNITVMILNLSTHSL